jgi:hypothetical protein
VAGPAAAARTLTPCLILIALDPRLANDRAVALVVIRDQLAKAFGADEIEIVAERRQLLLHVGERGDFAELPADALGEFARSLGGSGDAEPDADIELPWRGGITPSSSRFEMR